MSGLRVLERVGTALLDALYPSKCALCGLIHECAICDDCMTELEDLRVLSGPAAHDLISSRSSVYAFSGRAAQAVKRLKFERVTSLAAPMARLLAASAQSSWFVEVDAVIPVPIHWRRRLERGFNQSELLCEQMRVAPVRPELLERRRRTRPQVGLTPIERLTNLRGAFRASPDVAGASVLLVDDVYTSGGTAAECARALRAQGAREVRVLTFCGPP